jgi:hypothetical protein
MISVRAMHEVEVRSLSAPPNKRREKGKGKRIKVGGLRQKTKKPRHGAQCKKFWERKRGWELKVCSLGRSRVFNVASEALIRFKPANSFFESTLRACLEL